MNEPEEFHCLGKITTLTTRFPNNLKFCAAKKNFIVSLQLSSRAVLLHGISNTNFFYRKLLRFRCLEFSSKTN